MTRAGAQRPDLVTSLDKSLFRKYMTPVPCEHDFASGVRAPYGIFALAGICSLLPSEKSNLRGHRRSETMLLIVHSKSPLDK